MKLQQLRYFIQVAESGSFTKAATKLNIAQAALSRQVRLLEDDLGVALFRRDGRGVELTAAGKDLLQRANGIFTELYEMRRSVMSYRNTVEGNVIIGMMPVFSVQVVPGLLLRVREMHPDVKITFMFGMSHAIHEWAIAGRIDFGVVSTSIQTSAYLVLDEIVCDRLHLVTNADPKAECPAGSVSLADATRYPLIIPTKANGIRTVIDRYAGEAGITFTPAIEVDSIEIIKRLVLKGAGRSILPRFSINEELEKGEFWSQPVTDPDLEYTVAITFPVERPLSPLSSAVARILREVAATELVTDPPQAVARHPHRERSLV